MFGLYNEININDNDNRVGCWKRSKACGRGVGNGSKTDQAGS